LHDALPISFAGTLVLDAGQIDLLENLINRVDSSLFATHPVQLKAARTICPEKSNKNNQKCFSVAIGSPTHRFRSAFDDPPIIEQMPNQHESQGESLGKCRMRVVDEDAESGRGVSAGVPRSGGGAVFDRAIHRRSL